MKSMLLNELDRWAAALEQENRDLREEAMRLMAENGRLLGLLTTVQDQVDQYKLRWILSMAPGTKQDPLAPLPKEGDPEYKEGTEQVKEGQ